MASSVGRLHSVIARTIVPRRTFTSGKVLRCHPAGLPNDTMPFMATQAKFNKTSFTAGYVVFCITGLMWPMMAARDQAIRIGQAVEDPSE